MTWLFLLSLALVAGVGYGWPCCKKSSSSSSSESGSSESSPSLPSASSQSSQSSFSAEFPSTCTGCEMGWPNMMKITLSNVKRDPFLISGQAAGCCGDDEDCPDASGTVICDIQPTPSPNESGGACTAVYRFDGDPEGCNVSGGVVTITQQTLHTACYGLVAGVSFGCLKDPLWFASDGCNNLEQVEITSPSVSYNLDEADCPNTCHLSTPTLHYGSPISPRGCCGREFDAVVTSA